MEKYSLRELCWSDELASAFAPYGERGLTPGRIAIEHRIDHVVLGEPGELRAEVAGALRHRAAGRGELPCVGDWVALEVRSGERRATIHAVLPRRTKFSRKVAGFETDEQVLAANIDLVFLVAPMDDEVNLRRLERYLTMARASGALPVVVLTKADLCDDVAGVVRRAETIALGVPVHAVSSVTGEGYGGLEAYLANHQTVAVLGSSGVGKSTLINHLSGDERQEVRDIRDDGKGRHTTTHRELVVLPRGGLIIDTPGMRELALWDESDGLDTTFGDISALADGCRFRDCRHAGEPGCAVERALREGVLSSDRLVAYRKLERELHFLHLKQDQRAAANERRKSRAMAKSHRRRNQLGS
ncbi:MAG: ribosome small subunit-dependent GTPase A [Actinomycetota bacterium]